MKKVKSRSSILVLSLVLVISGWGIAVLGADHLVISEVYYDALGTEPNEEWMEIYNSTGASVNLESYRIGDEETQLGTEGMYTFPAGSEITNEQVMVIANRATAFFTLYGFNPDFEIIESSVDVPNLTKDLEWGTGDIMLSNSNDEVLLLNKSGATYTEIDRVAWDQAPSGVVCLDIIAGHSLERCPAQMDTDDCEADFVDQPDPSTSVQNVCGCYPDTCTPTPSPTETPTLTGSETVTPTPTNTPIPPTPTSGPTHPVASGLLISEVMYDPASAVADDEWVELFNASMEESIPLAGLRLGDEETQGGGEGMYKFPDNATSIAPCTVIVIAYKASAFFTAYGFNPQYEMSDSSPDVPNLTKDQDWAGGSWTLSNSGDEVLLMNASYELIDGISYEGGSLTGVTPHPGVPRGHSLDRCPANQDTDDCSVDFVDEFPAAPGVPCGVDCPTPIPVSPTATPTATYTKTVTPTRTQAPTNTPTAVPSATATPSPAPCVLGVKLTMPSHQFGCNDVCFLNAQVCNNSGTNYGNVYFFVILEVAGYYYFYDTWGQDIDYMEINLADGYDEQFEIIPSFYWPQSGALDGVKFWGALTNTDITATIGEVAIYTFGFDC